MAAGRRAPDTGSHHAWSDPLWLLFPFFAILLCYAPVWLTEYGFSEDYRLLLSVAWRRGGLGNVESALASVATFTLPPFRIVAA